MRLAFDLDGRCGKIRKPEKGVAVFSDAPFVPP